LKDQEQVRKFTELGYAIGLRLNEDGSIADVIEGIAAAKSTQCSNATHQRAAHYRKS